jgi:hypothetical protein
MKAVNGMRLNGRLSGKDNHTDQKLTRKKSLTIPREFLIRVIS